MKATRPLSSGSAVKPEQLLIVSVARAARLLSSGSAVKPGMFSNFSPDSRPSLIVIASSPMSRPSTVIGIASSPMSSRMCSVAAASATVMGFAAGRKMSPSASSSAVSMSSCIICQCSGGRRLHAGYRCRARGGDAENALAAMFSTGGKHRTAGVK